MDEDNWDLQAVVRGCGGSTTAAARDPFSSFPPSHDGLIVGDDNDDLLFCFPDLLANHTALQELEELCKPFFSKSPPLPCPSPPPPQQQQQQQMLSMSGSGSPSSSSAASLLQGGGAVRGRIQQPLLPQQQQQTRQPQPQQRSLPQNSRSKRRKNQQKKVVCQVPADGLSSDMWAWRKYGQKPIKGSPYPRGYYRCSSSKGCLARKQVERSRTDPGMFVITYTAEHNHPLPTHRNSLAGSTRHKFPQPSPTAAAPTQVNAAGGVDPEGDLANNKAASFSPLSSITVAGLSPTTPLTSSMEDELLLPKKEGGGEDEVEEEDDEVEEEGMLLVSDMEMLGEDDMLFMGLEELGDSSSSSTTTAAAAFAEGLPDHFPTAFSTSPWMANSNNTAAAAGGS